LPDMAGISHLDLTVRDLDRSTAWYLDVLGLTELRRDEHPGRRVSVLYHPGSRLVIGLNEHDANPGEAFDERRTGLDHVGFRVDSRDDLEAWGQHLDERDVTRSPIADTPVGSALVFRDPDQIQLEFWAKRSG